MPEKVADCLEFEQYPITKQPATFFYFLLRKKLHRTTLHLPNNLGQLALEQVENKDTDGTSVQKKRYSVLRLLA